MWVFECDVIGSLIHSSSFQQSVCRDHHCCAVIVLLHWMGENRVLQYAVVWCSWFTKPDACVQFDCDLFSTVIPSLAAPFPTFPPLLNSVRLKSSSALNLRIENKQKVCFWNKLFPASFLIHLLPKLPRTSIHPPIPPPSSTYPVHCARRRQNLQAPHRNLEDIDLKETW